MLYYSAAIMSVVCGARSPHRTHPAPRVLTPRTDERLRKKVFALRGATSGSVASKFLNFSTYYYFSRVAARWPTLAGLVPTSAPRRTLAKIFDPKVPY